MDGVAALPLGCSDIGNKRKITCSGLAANDGFIYYSYDFLSYDDDEDDDDHDHDHDDDDHDARGVMIRMVIIHNPHMTMPLMQRLCR